MLCTERSKYLPKYIKLKVNTFLEHWQDGKTGTNEAISYLLHKLIDLLQRIADHHAELDSLKAQINVNIELYQLKADVDSLKAQFGEDGEPSDKNKPYLH